MNFSKHADLFSEQEESTPNITPLVDVIFLLLIFFMLTTSFNTQKSIEVDLPSANASATKNETIVQEVTIDEKLNIYLEDKVLSLEQLKATLSKAKEESPSLQLIIRADSEAKHGKVVEILDLSSQLNIESVSVAVRSK